QAIGWSLLFSLALGTLFYAAFSSIYEDAKSTCVRVAVVESADVAGSVESADAAGDAKGADGADAAGDAKGADGADAAGDAKGADGADAAGDAKGANGADAAGDAKGTKAAKSVESAEGTGNKGSTESTGAAEGAGSADIAGITDFTGTGTVNMCEMLKELEYEDGKKMLDVVETDYDGAVELLKKDKDDKDAIKGIIDIRDIEDIKLILPGEKKVESAAFVSSSGIDESILSSIVSVFRQYSSIVAETVKNDPTKLTGVLESFEDETNELVENKSISGNNKDPYVSYFYSLITMMAMMAAMAGASVPESSQANQSPTGARVDVSPVNKSLYDLAGLLSAIVVQVSITLIGLVYLVYVLKINFGGDLKFVFLTAVLATILGVSLGFFIYQFGSISKKARENLIMTIILGGGFLSGLMIANMKTIVEMKCPIVNRINPSAVISDAFYALNMYGVGDRYYKSLFYIVGLTLFCIIFGLIMSRRRSYASL
nr:ABC transporter permease [Lachnospiraceae bacterium]